MKVMDKYLSRILFHGFASSLGIVAGLLVLQRFYRIIDLAVNRSLDIIQTLSLVLWALPLVLFYSLPIAAIVGTLITFGKLSADSELIGALAAGISRPRMARIPFLFAVIIAVLSLWNNMVLMPLGYVAFDNVGFGVGVDPMKALRPGVIERVSGRHLLLGGIDSERNHFTNLFAVVPGADAGYSAGKLIMTAKEGDWSLTGDAILMNLQQGQIREISTDTRIRMATFGSYTLRLPLPTGRSTEAKRLTMQELLADRRPEKIRPHMIEFSRRLLEALAIPLLIFCALPLAMPKGAAAARGTGSKGVVWFTFLLYFLYWLSAFLSESVVIQHSLPIFFLAVPHVLLFLTAGFLWSSRR